MGQSARPAHQALVSEAGFIAAQDISAARGPVPRAAPATGIDYLALIGAAHDTQLAGKINYAALLGGSHDPGRLPGQMTIDEALTGSREDR